MPYGVPYCPTEEQRRMVKAMAGYGVPHEGIAVMLEIFGRTKTLLRVPRETSEGWC